jgi:hypothetical protein
MTQEQLTAVMLNHMNNFNNENVKLNSETKLDEVLSTSDGYGAANSANLFKNVIRWTFWANKTKMKRWPGDWLKLTAPQLASKILMILLLLIGTAAQSQIRVDLSTINTVNNNNAIQVDISYTKALDSLFDANDIFVPGRNSLFALTPEFNINTGTSDAFSSITAKLTGMFMRFGTTEVSGIRTVNTSQGFHVFPVSIGVETHNKFNTLNVLAEAGYVPYYQTSLVPDWMRQTKIGFFLQAGYKLNWDSTSAPIGGQIDESAEEPNEGLLRFKTSAEAAVNTPVTLGNTKVGLVGSGDVWFDLANKATYYRYDAVLRFHVAPSRWIDAKYQKGSGAPNFNQGDQYGIGLTVVF